MCHYRGTGVAQGLQPLYCRCLHREPELELRRTLANNSPMAIIQRHGTRAAGSRGIYEGDPVPDRLDQLQRANPGSTP